MRCPECNEPMVWWSDSTVGSFGWGCVHCVLFWYQVDDTWVSLPLADVHFPPRLRSTPSYRNAVGWAGPA